RAPSRRSADPAHVPRERLGGEPRTGLHGAEARSPYGARAHQRPAGIAGAAPSALREVEVELSQAILPASSTNADSVRNAQRVSIRPPSPSSAPSGWLSSGLRSIEYSC